MTVLFSVFNGTHKYEFNINHCSIILIRFLIFDKRFQAYSKKCTHFYYSFQHFSAHCPPNETFFISRHLNSDHISLPRFDSMWWIACFAINNRTYNKHEASDAFSAALKLGDGFGFQIVSAAVPENSETCNAHSIPAQRFQHFLFALF